LPAPLPEADAARWRLAMGDAPEPARFDDGALVFNPLTWETHLVNPAAMQILDALRAAPRDTAALTDVLVAGRELDHAERATYAAQVGAALAEMAVLGLVCRDEARV
jgi:PqqD family protein of HPr-rel-A system